MTSDPITPSSLEAAPTERAVALRLADFATLIDALEYAALAGTGASFHDGRGRLARTVSWRELRDQARRIGASLAALGQPRGSRVAIVAETRPEFIAAFFGARYAALVPVPLPASVHLGGHAQYVELIGRMIDHADASIAIASEAFLPFLNEVAESRALQFVGDVSGLAPPANEQPLPAAPSPDEIAYIQYTSGSTRFPRGAMLTERSTLRNVLAIVRDGLQIREGDRFCSWLPLYHDMGLVGKMIVPIASQCSIDYLGTREFAMRPRLWPRMITDREATISFAPPFGYELTSRRLRPGDAESYDLSRWRIAGCGADMIRPDVLETFTEALAPGGFDAAAITPSYGMAEVSLAVSFTPCGRGLAVDEIDGERRARDGTIVSAPGSARFTCCGRPLPDYRVEIRSDDGAVLADCQEGAVFLHTPSTMEGYHGAPELNREILRDGWLDTGDLGYLRDGELVLTGRRKDLIIVNGRNIWPQDLEHVAESFRGVRSGDAAAFTVDDDAETRIVLLLQCRERDDDARSTLVRAIHGELRASFGVDPVVHPVPPHSLPKTTSGKLSRARAREAYLAGLALD